jgi:hypothetical protein
MCVCATHGIIIEVVRKFCAGLRLKEKRMKKSITILVLAAVLISACGAQKPATQDAPPATRAVIATATAVPPTSTPTEVPPSTTPEPSPTATPKVTLFPTVTFTETVVCRLGPDANYYPVVNFTKGQTSQAQGRSEDGAWLIVMSQVKIKSSTCWAPVASVADFGNVDDLTVSIAPPLPVGPSRATATKVACGNRLGTGPLTLYWFPAVDGVGYYIYRNGKNLATIFGDYYVDHDTPNSKAPYVYTYGVQAFNSVGLSKVTASVSVTLCK